jgi:uncharacterized protein (TIGR02118 family)
VIKVVALLRRRPDLSRAQFLDYWRTAHAPVVGELPGLRRYIQNHPIEHRNEWPYDGSAELWFDSVGDVARAFAGPAADAMREDERSFVESIEWFLAHEHEIALTGEER